MYKNQGSLPQNVGYGDFRGLFGVSDMYTEWQDVYFNPELALSPERFAMMEKKQFNHNDVHCTPLDRNTSKDIRLINLDYITVLDEA
ncbi:hypothetical protein [uncultured Microbulbifer sp.]|uniref:hypothetical protein n=1 Tax=uncultured Microbulbifer sp. TaxID=348147 RepID=UPI002623BB22|nr:hypothetical protein [uncultured Microbulbifer sp.]